MHSEHGLGIEFDNLCGRPGLRQHDMRRQSVGNGRGRRGGGGVQERIKSGKFQHLPDHVGCVDNEKPPLDGFELPRIHDQDANAGGTHVVHFGHVHGDDVLARLHAFRQGAGHVVAPTGIHPALQFDLELFSASSAGDLHGQAQG